MKVMLKKMANKFGYDIVRKRVENHLDISDRVERHITHLEILAKKAQSIPTMISVETAKFLYSLCYMQDMDGDVLEVGSWQGFSTAFLASAVKESGNGKCYAVDHFKGSTGENPTNYMVGESDLSDLKSNFTRNMKMIGVENYIELFDMPSEEAAEKLKNKKIRFLFIDGDHTEEGVKKDIKNFFPLLSKGSIVVFDDFHNNFPGVVKAVTELVQSSDFSRSYSYFNTFVIKI